jgi:hypothetical protein
MGQGEKAWPLSQPQLLGGADYPTHDWPAGAVVRTSVDLLLPPDVETGDYNLGMRLLDAHSEISLADWVLGQIQVMGRTRSFEAPPMQHSLGTDFGGQVKLLGYDLGLSHVGEDGALLLTLYWQAQREMETAYRVFVHVVDESQHIVGQVDQEPQAGSAPTTGWLAGEVVMDAIEVKVAEEMADVRSIAIGLYDPLSGKRVPVFDAGGAEAGDFVRVPVP